VPETDGELDSTVGVSGCFLREFRVQETYLKSSLIHAVVVDDLTWTTGPGVVRDVMQKGGHEFRDKGSNVRQADISGDIRTTVVTV
jgi:hypothetical protein